MPQITVLADGSTADGNTADNSTADNSTADGSTADGSTADGSTADGNIADNSQDLAIHISLPDGVNFSSTKIRDLYSDNELILEIPGNYYDYYNKIYHKIHLKMLNP